MLSKKKPQDKVDPEYLVGLDRPLPNWLRRA